MEPHLDPSVSSGTDPEVGWWNVDAAGKPILGPYRLWDEAEEPEGIPDSQWGDLIYGRKIGEAIEVLVAPEEAAYDQHVGEQLRQVENINGEAPVPEGQGGDRHYTVDVQTPAETLAIAIGTALVDVGFRLQSINMHEQDELGGVTVWPAPGGEGVYVSWGLHYFMAIRWPRGDVSQTHVKDVMNDCIAQTLSVMGFTVVTGANSTRMVIAGPDAYLTQPVLHGTPHLPNQP